MAAAYLPIVLERNSTYAQIWYFTDDNDAPLDISAWNIEMSIKYAAGLPDPGIVNATLNIVSGPGGALGVQINGSSFAAVPGAMETVELAYDLRAIVNTVPTVHVKGPLYLEPGVTM